MYFVNFSHPFVSLTPDTGYHRENFLFLTLTSKKEERIMTHLIARFAVLCLTLIFLSIPAALVAQEAVELDVDISAICTGVSELEPVGTAVSFPVSVGKLFCYTRIIGAQTPNTISHVWFYGQAERARIDLSVKSSRWRTYSSKVIQPHEIGSWHVNVMDAEGNVLKVVQFITTAEGESEAAPEMSQPNEPPEMKDVAPEEEAAPPETAPEEETGVQ